MRGPPVDRRSGGPLMVRTCLRRFRYPRRPCRPRPRIRALPRLGSRSRFRLGSRFLFLDEAQLQVACRFGLAADQPEPHEEHEPREDEPLAGVAEVLEGLQIESGALRRSGRYGTQRAGGLVPGTPAGRAAGVLEGHPRVVHVVRHEVDQGRGADHAQLAVGKPALRVDPRGAGVLGRLEITGHRDRAGRCGGHGGVAGLAGQPAAYHRQSLAAVRTEHVQYVEAAPVVQLPSGHQELVGVPAGGDGGTAGGHRVDGQELLDRLGGSRARGGLLLGGVVRLHAVLEAAELPGAHEHAERDGQHDEEVDSPPSRGQQEPVHPSTVRSPLRPPGAGCRRRKPPDPARPADYAADHACRPRPPTTRRTGPAPGSGGAGRSPVPAGPA